MVSEAVDGFLHAFAEALVIIIVVVTLFMGWRMGVVIGFALIFTLCATFIVMALAGIDLQRVSLGALVIALGMMVDNAIVTADGYLLRCQKGMSPETAAVEAGTVPSMPLLGGTVIAVMSFYPIFASTEDVGEYCGTLFTVIAIALLVSWVISVTITPLQCIDLLKEEHSSGEADPFAGRFFRIYRRFLEGALAARWLVLTVMIVLLVAAVAGFGQVRQLFFPDSSMAKFMVDYWAPEGTRIQTVSTDLRAAEDWLLADERVEGVATFVGSGPPRFYLPVDPELPNPSYGQLIVNVGDARDIDELLADLDPWLRQTYPDALPVVRKYGVGPSNTWKLEARLIGPADVAPDALQAVAKGIVGKSRESRSPPTYGQTGASGCRRSCRSSTRSGAAGPRSPARISQMRRSGPSTGARSASTARTTTSSRSLHATSRRTRQNVAAIDVLQIQPAGSTLSVPVAEVVDQIGTGWEDPLIWRRDRRRTITIQSNPILGVAPPEVQAAVAPDVESACRSRPGSPWNGAATTNSSNDANGSLVPGMIPAVAVMLLTVVALFNAFRPPLIVFLMVPFALIGITGGLLGFDVPFGFMALLGAMSLAGQMIRNAIVLVDQIGIDRASGLDTYEAVVQSAMSRLRPVMLSAGTAALGVIPLLQDVFWVGMAVTMMGGLAIGTVLIMIWFRFSTRSSTAPILWNRTAISLRSRLPPERPSGRRRAERTAVQNSRARPLAGHGAAVRLKGAAASAGWMQGSLGSAVGTRYKFGVRPSGRR